MLVSKELKGIIYNIKLRASQLIVEEIISKGCSSVANPKACIDKVKLMLDIDLEVNENGNLIFKE